MLLMEEKRDGQVPDLLFRVLGGRDEVDGLQVTKIDIVALDVDVQQLADVLLFLVAVEFLGLVARWAPALNRFVPLPVEGGIGLLLWIFWIGESRSTGRELTSSLGDQHHSVH